jgi:type I restriction enzyme, S subunit
MNLSKDKWEKVKLMEVCELINGRAYSAHELLDAGTPVLRVGNFFTNEKWYFSNLVLEDRKYCNSGDLLYAWSASFGPRIWEGGKVIFHYHIWKVDVSDKTTKQFLYYVLENETKKIKSSSHGTTMPHITKGAMEMHSIPLPPLEEQKQIAALFLSIGTAVENIDGQEKNLLRLKNKLLQDLFSDKQEFGNHLKARDFETVRFDKIAINISERVEPKKTGLTTYVGLEHLDADNLKIERTGTPNDVIGTKLKIYKGDIIFGKRRAYLRKVAVSYFDGIASAHSMILRANEKNIEKDFLPYFMQSDTFMNRAVQISEGSLSPTIKNKTLAQQEFMLPKKEKQKELIAVFKQFDLTLNQLKQQKLTLKNLKHKLLNEILG